MPLPLILGIGAGLAALAGLGAGFKGAMDMVDANDTLKEAKKRDEENRERHKEIDQQACESTDRLGVLEMNVLSSFNEFSDLIEKIKNRPTFADIKIGVDIPKYDQRELKQASIGASILVGGLTGAALGTASGFAASGATTAAVMALGTASTGTAISSLSGAAAINATLAALGGGSLAAGGGGIALGTAVLSGATFGIGLLVGGLVFSLVGSNVTDKANEAYNQMLENEKVINAVCAFLTDLKEEADRYYNDIDMAYTIYKDRLRFLKYIVRSQASSDGTVDWRQLRELDKVVVNNVVMLVGLLYHMCKVPLVKEDASGKQINVVNKEEIYKARRMCAETLATIDKIND